MDSAKYGGVVGQRKLSCAATGKGSMSKVSPGLWWWHEKICKIRCITLICSMVIVISNSHRGSTDSIPGGSQIYSAFLSRNWRVKTMGRRITRLCAGGINWLLENEGNWDGLLTAKTRSARGVSYQPAWLLVMCGSLVYLVADGLRPSVLWHLMIVLGGSVDVFLTLWVWFYL